MQADTTVDLPYSQYEDAAPETVLKDVFGYDEFRPLQREVIERTLRHEDTLVIMPTGGGKSLCYQVPALIFTGLTVVVSPLIALMKDQVGALVQSGVKTAFLNSTLSADEWQETASRVAAGQVKLLYAAPEGLNTRRMREVLHAPGVQVDCITVDEAHCVSQWGHDFRPDYMSIAGFRHEFPDAVMLALTATATEHVRQDIVKNLDMHNAEIIVSSFNRANIYLEVKPKKKPLEQVYRFIRSHKGESGIVYCSSRNKVDKLSEYLRQMGVSAAGYHAGLTAEERTKRQDDFVNGRVDVMAATVAFGMGINVPNVRFVIHHDLPKSIEQYYQEIGRAGRDGLPSTALLLYGKGDISIIRNFFFNDCADREKAEALLQSMINYAETTTCRRQAILRYFGEDAATGNGGEKCCDVCAHTAKYADYAGERRNRSNATWVWKNTQYTADHGQDADIASDAPAADNNDAACVSAAEPTDVTIPAQKFLSCIYRVGGGKGASYVINVLLGSDDMLIKKNGHDKISTYNIGHEYTRRQWHMLEKALLSCGMMKTQGEYYTLEITPKGYEALRSRSPIMLVLGANTAASQADETGDSLEDRIVAAIKSWRRRVASDNGVPPYFIFGDATVLDIARKKPRTEYELLDVSGIGKVKLQNFGEAILSIVQEAVRE